MEFYVYLNGVRRGPFGTERMRAFLAEGILQSSDLVSSQLEGELKPARTFTELEPSPELRAVPAPPIANLTPSPPPPASVPPAAPGSAVTSPSAAGTQPVSNDALWPYARATLAPDEIPYFKTSLHWIVFVRFGFFALVVFFLAAIPFAIAVQAITGSEAGWFALPLPVFFMVPPAVAFAGSELVITNRRVLIKTGIVRRQSLEMFVSKIESVAVDQGFGGRLLDYGTVIIRGT